MLTSELVVVVSLRTVERAVSHVRRVVAAEALVTVRLETPPSRQLQIGFGKRRVGIEGELEKVHLFVVTLGYPRLSDHNRQQASGDVAAQLAVAALVAAVPRLPL